MNPIRVFLSIFTFGIALTIILGIVGFRTDIAGDHFGEGEPNQDQAMEHPAYIQSCITCHGSDLRGTGQAPGLRNLAHLTEDEIVQVITEGRNGMPGGLISGEEEEAAAYLLSIQDE